MSSSVITEAENSSVMLRRSRKKRYNQWIRCAACARRGCSSGYPVVFSAFGALNVSRMVFRLFVSMILSVVVYPFKARKGEEPAICDRGGGSSSEYHDQSSLLIHQAPKFFAGPVGTAGPLPHLPPGQTCMTRRQTYSLNGPSPRTATSTIPPNGSFQTATCADRAEHPHENQSRPPGTREGTPRAPPGHGEQSGDMPGVSRERWTRLLGYRWLRRERGSLLHGLSGRSTVGRIGDRLRPF